MEEQDVFIVISGHINGKLMTVEFIETTIKKQ